MVQLDTSGILVLNKYMPARNEPLVNGEYYHILNRGVAKMPIFVTNRDYQRFIGTFRYYVDGSVDVGYSKSTREEKDSKPKEQIVEVVSYCLMPNHFHFLLKQNLDDGIRNFIRKTTNSYAKYFNIKRKRKGPIFEGKFKAIRIESNEQLLHLTRYIHLNPLIGYITQDLNSYNWSSYPEYLGNSELQICSKEIILEQFKTSKDYERFVLDDVDYARKLNQIKHELLEEQDNQWV